MFNNSYRFYQKILLRETDNSQNNFLKVSSHFEYHENQSCAALMYLAIKFHFLQLLVKISIKREILDSEADGDP